MTRGHPETVKETKRVIINLVKLVDEKAHIPDSVVDDNTGRYSASRRIAQKDKNTILSTAYRDREGRNPVAGESQVRKCSSPRSSESRSFTVQKLVGSKVGRQLDRRPSASSIELSIEAEVEMRLRRILAACKEQHLVAQKQKTFSFNSANG